MRGAFYDPLGHRYTFDGVEWPGVTTVLRVAGHIDARWFTPGAAAHGRQVHAYTVARDTLGTLAEQNVDPDCGGELDAYEKFLRDNRPVWACIERGFFHQQLRYGGRPDRVFKNMFGTPGVLEIKTGSAAAWHALQLAGYQRLRPAGARYVLYLGKNGRYRLEHCRCADDHGRFLRALEDTWQQWKAA